MRHDTFCRFVIIWKFCSLKCVFVENSSILQWAPNIQMQNNIWLWNALENRAFKCVPVYKKNSISSGELCMCNSTIFRLVHVLLCRRTLRLCHDYSGKAHCMLLKLVYGRSSFRECVRQLSRCNHVIHWAVLCARIHAHKRMQTYSNVDRLLE